MTMKRRWGREAAIALIVSWSLCATAWGADGDIRIAVAPLEVHGTIDTLEGAARDVRAGLRDGLGALDGLVGVIAPKDAKDATAEPLTVEALERAAGTSRAAYVVYGSITQLGGTYSFDARLFDPNVGKARAAFFREGAGRDDLIAKLPDLAAEIKKAVEPPKAALSETPPHDTGKGQVSSETADSSNEEPEAEKREKNPLGLRVRDNKAPIAISSDTLEAINTKNTVVFRGNVEARQSGLRILCDTMTVIYSPDGKGIIKIIADRNVRITHEGGGEGGPASGTITATCDKGIYHNAEGRIDLTGNPVVKRGYDTVMGEQISVYLDDNRFTVRRAKVTISPEGMRSLNSDDEGQSADPGEGD